MPVVNPGVVCFPARGPHSTSQDLYARTVAIDSNDIVELDFGAGMAFAKVGLVRFKVKRVAGAGANFQPYIFSKSGVTTAGDIAQEYAGSSTAVGTLFDPQLADAPVWMQCDADGKLYMVLAPDAGADNTFDYCLRFLKAE
jgi:hypothetical protein